MFRYTAVPKKVHEARGGAFSWDISLQAGKSRIDSRLSPEFFIDIIFPTDSAYNINEYQEYFLGGGGGW